MSLLQFRFESQFLGGATTVSALLPNKPAGLSPEEFYRSGKKYKVLWLLHGTAGDDMDWLRRTNIELYTDGLELAVVMPSGLNSIYSNWPDYMLGYNMFDYLTKELMPLVYGWLPVSEAREDNFIAGLSMGGRGAIKYAVNHPARFAAAAVLSAVPMDFEEMRPGHPNIMLDLDNKRVQSSIRNAGGLEAFKDSYENVWRLMDEQAGKGTLPRLFFGCGADDAMLIGKFRDFQSHAEKIGLDAEFFIAPGYRHEWAFWDLGIRRALRFFGFDGPELNERGK